MLPRVCLPSLVGPFQNAECSLWQSFCLLKHPQKVLVFPPWYLNPLGITNNNNDDDDIKTEAVPRLGKSQWPRALPNEG